MVSIFIGELVFAFNDTQAQHYDDRKRPVFRSFGSDCITVSSGLKIKYPIVYDRACLIWVEAIIASVLSYDGLRITQAPYTIFNLRVVKVLCVVIGAATFVISQTQTCAFFPI
jgi:hypothetical protein